MLSRDAIEEFKNLYLKEYGIKLSNQKAIEYGTKLIDLVKLVYGSNLPKKWIFKIDRKVSKEIG